MFMMYLLQFPRYKYLETEILEYVTKFFHRMVPELYTGKRAKITFQCIHDQTNYTTVYISKSAVVMDFVYASTVGIGTVCSEIGSFCQGMV